MTETRSGDGIREAVEVQVTRTHDPADLAAAAGGGCRGAAGEGGPPGTGEGASPAVSGGRIVSAFLRAGKPAR